MFATRVLLISLAFLLAACGYAGERGDDYKHSLASYHPISVLQIEQQRLRTAPKKAFVFKSHDADTDVDTIAFPASNGAGYVVFTANAGEGRVLSVPEDQPIELDLKTLAALQRKKVISDAVVAELVRRSS